MATTGAQYQAQINALKAMAAVVEVDEETFRALLRSRSHPTIVAGISGALWFKRRTYLTSYDGFVFLLRADQPLDFQEEAGGALYVDAKQVNIPFM
jgi:hypothetical protein